MNNKIITFLLEKAPVFQTFALKAEQVCSHSFDKARCADFLAPLLLRLYLVPIFSMAGISVSLLI